MRAGKKNLLFLLGLLVGLVVSGCAGQEIRHLASDACLIVPGQMDRQQVLALMGPPDQRVELAEGGEQWRYFQSQKSLLRRTPYVGEKLGDEKVDVLTITFQAAKVGQCVYRQLERQEFDQLGIETHEVFE